MTRQKQTKTDSSNDLNIEQKNAIDLLVAGQTDAQVGQAVGVARQTVWEWRNRNALFIAELNKRRQDIWGAQVDRLRSLVSAAVDVFEDDLTNSTDPEVRRKAALHVLKCVGLHGAKLEPTGDVSASDIQRQWARDDLYNVWP